MKKSVKRLIKAINKNPERAKALGVKILDNKVVFKKKLVQLLTLDLKRKHVPAENCEAHSCVDCNCKSDCRPCEVEGNDETTPPLTEESVTEMLHKYIAIPGSTVRAVLDNDQRVFKFAYRGYQLGCMQQNATGHWLLTLSEQLASRLQRKPKLLEDFPEGIAGLNYSTGEYGLLCGFVIDEHVLQKAAKILHKIWLNSRS